MPRFGWQRIGGVVALMVQDGITFAGTERLMTGKGFRGGGIDARPAAQVWAARCFCSTNTADGAEGGKASRAIRRALVSGFGRGARANGGGGGNYARAGGGGGGNGDSALAWNGHGVMENNITGAMVWTLDPGYTGNANQPHQLSAGGGYGGAENDRNGRPPRPWAAGWSRRSATGSWRSGGRPLSK